MEWSKRMKQIRHDIERLSRFPTVHEILVQYLQVIYSHLENCQPYCTTLLMAFEALLSYELWHHKAMTKLAQSQELQMRYLVPLGVEMRMALLKLVRKLESLSVYRSEEIIVRELLKAHCYYQLGDIYATINCLEEVVNQGATDPVIYFVLGYNRHRLALSEYARWEPIGQKLIVTDKEAFEQNLKKAIDNFRSGLSYSEDETMDARLNFWIGLVHEILGEREEAIRAYQRAKEIDPENYGEEVERRLKQWQLEETMTSHRQLPSVEFEEKNPVKPISESELEAFKKALREIETISDLFRRMESSPGQKEPSEEN
ncbi:MAG: tetratricopeptide repeat protein [Armatimonadetes bacterium]|nr:tetratricopeptide repeat protein [Armatimonadota bacterium]MDW8028966.1 tetratricopeptide repeat protein [Armatimonadota bacterium]